MKSTYEILVRQVYMNNRLLTDLIKTEINERNLIMATHAMIKANDMVLEKLIYKKTDDIQLK